MRAAAPLLGAALVMALGGEAFPQTAESHHAAGVEALRAGQEQQALAEFRAAVKIDRNHLPSLLDMADLLSSGGRVFEAYPVLQYAVSIAPGSAQAHALLGRSFSVLGRLKDAREELGRAIQLDPAPAEPYYGLAAVERRLGRLADARRHADAFLERSPDDRAARELRAALALESKDYDAALAAYRELQKAQPEAPGIERGIARTLMAAGRYEEAAQAFKASSDRDPSDHEAVREWYEASHQRGADPEAAEALQRLAALEPQSCEPLLLLARTYHHMGRFADARQRAGACLRLEAGHAGAHFLIGWTWLGEGDLEKARTEFEQALRADPASVEALYWLGTVELRRGSQPAALRLLEKAVSVDADYAGAHYELGRVYSALGREADAQKQFAEFRRLKAREAWRSAPPGADAALHVEDSIAFANYLIGEKKPREALVLLEAAAQAAPANAEVRLLTAAARTETGDIEEALAAYAEAEKRGAAGLLYWGRGLLYRQLREDERALADLRRAVAMDLPPTQAATARRAIGGVLAQRRRWPEAEAELKRATLLEPGNAAAHTLLAQVLLESGKPAEAAREAEQALAGRPDDAEARLAHAWAWAEQKRYEDAAAEIARAVQIEGETARVWLARGRLSAAQGNASLAADHLGRAAQADPTAAEVFFLMGMENLEAGRVSEAALSLEKATIVDPTDAASWTALGRIYLAANRVPAAMKYLEKGAAAAPEDAEAVYQLAVGLALAGRRDEAAAAARRAGALGHPGAAALLKSLTPP
jgi:tetratricopeptide (TPR) repeat protein